MNVVQVMVFFFFFIVSRLECVAREAKTGTESLCRVTPPNVGSGKVVALFLCVHSTYFG